MREEKRILNNKISPKVIFEDSSLLVVCKPSGMVVNRALTCKEETLQDWLEDYFSKKDKSLIALNNGLGIGRRMGIVHRLDKETSGVLLVAKTQSSFEALQSQFKKREVLKKYVCLVYGKIAAKEGQIKADIARNPQNRKKFGVFLSGRSALTDYKLISYYTLDKEIFSLVEALPKTGRTHQIRVHMMHIGYPIVSDFVYAGKKRAKKTRVWCPRVFLHSRFISFTHPETDKRTEFEIDLPEDLKLAIDNLTPLQS